MVIYNLCLQFCVCLLYGAQSHTNFRSSHKEGTSWQHSKNGNGRRRRNMKINSKQIIWQTRQESKPWVDIISFIADGCIHCLLSQTLWRFYRDLYKELIEMSHRCSGMNLTNMWEGSGSNNTLDCIDGKSFILLIYDCVFEHELLCVLPLNFRKTI